ncbi:MAG: hypothetical protein AB1716_00870 [Planctomycetota bacterium]
METNLDRNARVATFLEDCPILEDLSRIRRFSFAVQHANVSALAQRDFQVLIADHLAQEMAKFVTEQELHQLDCLECEPGEKQIDVTYNDDVCHFQASLNDHIFAVTRKGSTMDEFHRFYGIVAPFLPMLYASTVRRIEEVSQSRIKIAPFLCTYRFDFTLSSFKPTGKGRKDRIPNFVLMDRLVPFFSASPFKEMNFSQVSRTDVKLSAWKEFGGAPRDLWFDIKAPANRQCSIMELSFAYQGGTHTDTGGTRKPFDPKTLEEWDVALIDFLKNLVFNKFLMSWLKDVSFVADPS